MNERIARLRAHQNNVDRYQSLLKTELTDREMDYLEKRLSEERMAINMLEVLARPSNDYDLSA